MQIRGKRTILTGASRGLGVHIARALAKEGADLVLVARDTPLLAIRELFPGIEGPVLRSIGVLRALEERASPAHHRTNRAGSREAAAASATANKPAPK